MEQRRAATLLAPATRASDFMIIEGPECLRERWFACGYCTLQLKKDNDQLRENKRKKKALSGDAGNDS